MKALIFIGAVILIKPSNGFAQNPDSVIGKLLNINKPKACQIDPKMEYACDSLSTLSCKPGTFDDGTGRVLSKDEFKNKVDDAALTLTSNYKKAIEKMLNDSDPKYNLVRELAIRATQQVDTPDCGSSQKKDLKVCYERVSSLLAKKQSNREFGVRNGPAIYDVSVNADFAALNDLINNQNYIDGISKSHEKSIRYIKDEKTEKKIEKKIFPKVQKILIDKIRASVSDETIRNKMITKVQNISFKGSDCSELGANLSSYLISNAFYDPENQIFKYCNGMMLENNSEFSLAMIVAHELSHSIDPCNIERPKSNPPMTYKKGVEESLQDYEAQFPIKGLAACLRSTESIGALVGGDPKANGYQFKFCFGDQIGESFSDWMGSEVLADYIEQNHAKLSPEKKLLGFSNVARHYCGEDSPLFDVHPKSKDRIDRILMANPKIRQMVGCGEPKNGLHYCKVGEDFTGTRAEFKLEPNNGYPGGGGMPGGPGAGTGNPW